MLVVQHIPYLLLIAANLVYLCIHGFKPIQYHPKLILYNFLFFVLVATVVFFKVSYHLYRWFVKDEGDVREKTKIKLQELLRVVEIVCGYFRPGNLHNLVYVSTHLSSCMQFWPPGRYSPTWFPSYCWE
jgi:hypothetical protein